MGQIDSTVARHIVESIGSKGTPPEYGLEHYTAGLNDLIQVVEGEYLSAFVPKGGSVFKMVVGTYGGGKTHFLYTVRDLAWRHNFIVSYVSLSAEQSPFHKLELVYRAIARNLIPPLSPDELMSPYARGLTAFLRRWVVLKQQEYAAAGITDADVQEEILQDVNSISGIESLSFQRAMTAAVRSLLDGRPEEFEDICQWLTGEGYNARIHKAYGILERINKNSAFTMIRSLTQWLRQAGYSGLIILLDEAERVPSLSSKQREIHLSNLREIIDQCGQSNFQGVMLFYAVPDEGFLDGRTQVYEALKQRVETVFDWLNPTGVKIELERAVLEPIAFLTEIGARLRLVYEAAYDVSLDEKLCAETIDMVAHAANRQRHADIGYKRLFVQSLMRGFNFVRYRKAIPTLQDLGLE